MSFIRHIKNRFFHDRNMRRMLKEQNQQVSAISREVKQGVISIRTARLKDCVMTSKEKGVTDEKLCNEEVIISLTTYGKRINEVYLSVESIMQGTVKPNRIILLLAEDEFKGKILPKTLQMQQKRGLQVEYCDEIRSYKKIVPVMEKYPDACIVTIDDDLIYEFDLLENLIKAHIENPEDICACRMHRITLNSDNRPNSYMKWKWLVWPQDKSNLNFLTSGGGTLFPPHCFVNEFFNREAFMSLCPYADDVWINAMIWLSGRQICKAYTHSVLGCDFLETFSEQEEALCVENTNEENCRNDIQIKAVMDKYDLYHFLAE